VHATKATWASRRQDCKTVTAYFTSLQSILRSNRRDGGVSSSHYAPDGGVRFKQERVMKSRVINTFSAISQRLPRRFPRISQTGLALTGAVCVLTLSGCYYPYGYYPGGYYPYYATVPAGAAQQDVQVGPPDPQAAQQAQQQSSAQRAQDAQQNPPPAYTVAAVPPVYVAPPYPAYPAYYPPYPAYPAYYGYPGWYGPSVSIGVGFGGYWGGGHGGWGGHGHWH
jgi:hypothetical protein